jgi:HEAT repeat protein
MQAAEYRMEAAEYLENIDPGNETAISTMIELSQSGEDEITRMVGFGKLRNISLGNETAIAFLLDLFQTTQNGYIRQEAVGNLRQIVRGVRFPKVVTILKNYLPLTAQVEPIEFYCEEVIWHCAQNMSYPDFYRAWYGEHLSGQG